VGLRCGNPPRHLNQLENRIISLIETPSGQKICSPWYMFHRIFIETPFHKKKIKYQSWYLTPYCGLDVQYFFGIFIETPLLNLFSNIKFDIWHHAVGLRCGNPPRHLNQLKTRVLSLNEIPSGQELCRPWYIVHRICIETPLHKRKFKYQSWYLTPHCGL
jgi:hypothetical protein